MKRMWLAAILVFTLMIPACGVAAGENRQGTSSGGEGTLEFIHGSVPAQTGTMEGMLPPVNALVMCMAERDLVYDEASDLFIWNSLYYMLSLYGGMDGRAELTDDTLILPAETVQDFAAALFTSYHGLPALPDELSDRVCYDSAADSYLLARGDAGLTETVFYGVQTMADGSKTVSGAMIALEDGTELVPFQVVLRENDSMFGYAICALDLL